MGACHHCHAEITGETVDFHELCPVCHKPLHSCVNCKFYAPGSYHDCHEGVEELQEDKEDENFCDWFELGDGGPANQENHDAARARLEALFKS